VWLALPGWAPLSCRPGQPEAPAPASAAASLLAPVPAPRPSITGCVESPELKRYVLALDARRREARESALERVGARRSPRAGTWGEASRSLVLDSELASEGKRQVVVAQLAAERVAAGSAPQVALVQVGGVLYRVAERPRAHATPLLVCGLQRCGGASAAGQAAPPVRPVLVELQPGERWGGPLAIEYDYWWADVRYDRVEACPPGPAGVR